MVTEKELTHQEIIDRNRVYEIWQCYEAKDFDDSSFDQAVKLIEQTRAEATQRASFTAFCTAVDVFFDTTGSVSDETREKLRAAMLSASAPVSDAGKMVELIKEMRTFIEVIMKSGFDRGCKCGNCEDARTLLDRTKEYAE